MGLDPEFEKVLDFVAGYKEPQLFTPEWYVSGRYNQTREQDWRAWVQTKRDPRNMH